MKVKYKGNNVDIKNKADNPKKEFFAYFNNHTIDINFDEYGTKFHKKWCNTNPKNLWAARCHDEGGGCIVDGVFEGTMRNAVQICVDNME